MTGRDAAHGGDGGDGGTSPLSVLFVCTHNSARSIMAEALLRDRGGNRFVAHSAGTETAQVRPLTLQVLREAGLPTKGLRSKSVAEFEGRAFDYVITVCDSAQRDCPVFPGDGVRDHWSYDDPSVADGTDEQKLQAFRSVFGAISARIELFVNAERMAAGA